MENGLKYSFVLVYCFEIYAVVGVKCTLESFLKTPHLHPIQYVSLQLPHSDPTMAPMWATSSSSEQMFRLHP